MKTSPKNTTSLHENLTASVPVFQTQGSTFSNCFQGHAETIVHESLQHIQHPQHEDVRITDLKPNSFSLSTASAVSVMLVLVQPETCHAP